MPAIVNPNRGRPYEARSDEFSHTDYRAAPAPSVTLRIRTALHRSELTRALSAGADAAARPELELRAAQLTSSRNRKALARTLRRTVAEAHKPAATRARVVIIERAAVLDAEDAFAAMIGRLCAPAPVRAEGMAILERMLRNADRSPLYTPGEKGALGRLIRTAIAAMEPRPALFDEIPIAA
jgi:hypothetical protein